MGIAWGVLALGQWVSLAIDNGDARPAGGLRVFLGAFMTVLAAVYLTSAELLRRRRRAGGEPDG